MNEHAEIFDMKEENKPQKPPMSPKAKRFWVYILCGIIGIAVAALLIIAYNAIFSGAATPEKAIAEYMKAATLYDVDGIVEYSSEYNKIVLYGNRETSDRLLTAYLNKAYEKYEAKYTEDEISFKLISVLEYEKGEAKYNEVMALYSQRTDPDEEGIEKIAIVRMTIVKGTSETTRDYLAVKKGSRWYFAYSIV